MAEFCIISDPHIGLKRKSGVTHESLEALTETQLSILKDAVYTGLPLIIPGDLFDSFDVPKELMLRVIRILERCDKCYLVVGNHDVCSNSDKMSSLAFVANMLPNAELVSSARGIGPFFVIPHLQNQELFDQAIAEAPTGRPLLLHCNYDNFFATGKDHSLNLTPEQAKRFPRVYLAHEHNSRIVGNVVVLGSAFPVSISDCYTPKGYSILGNTYELIRTVETWNPQAGYLEIDWHELAFQQAQFVRVTGKAAVGEAPALLKALSSFRARSQAFLITNSVEVEGCALQTLQPNLEKVSVMDLMLKALPDKFKIRLKQWQDSFQQG